MRSIERRGTWESCEACVRCLAVASGIETPTRAELSRFDRSRKDGKASNTEWQSPCDPGAEIAKMKDGRTHVAHKAEHGDGSYPCGDRAGFVAGRFGDAA